MSDVTERERELEKLFISALHAEQNLALDDSPSFGGTGEWSENIRGALGGWAGDFCADFSPSVVVALVKDALFAEAVRQRFPIKTATEPAEIPTSGPGSNTGHGHVWPRPDRNKMRCGGTYLCKVCAKDAGLAEPTVNKIMPRMRAAEHPGEGWRDASWGDR